MVALAGCAIAVAGRFGLVHLPASALNLGHLLAVIGATALAGFLPSWWLGRARVRCAETAAAGEIASAGSLFNAGGSRDAALTADLHRLCVLAGWPQALVGGLAAGGAVTMAVWTLVVADPLGGADTVATSLGVVAAVLAAPLLVLERRLAATDPGDLPEAAALARLARLLVLGLAGGGLATAAAASGAPFAEYIPLVIAGLGGVAAGELLLRSLATPFVPIRDEREAIALADSAVLGVVLGWIGGQGGGLKERFGIDLSSSWALRWLRTAVPLAAVVLAFAAWLLTGVTVLALHERGILERAGAPLAVLPPGLHVHLPWPFATVRRIDHGQVRMIALGSSQAKAEQPTDPARRFDRLWEVRHHGEGEYLIPGRSSAGEAIPYVLSCDARIAWQIGDSDAAALAFHARVADPEALIAAIASRTLISTFARRQLDSVLGEDRDRLAEALRSAIQSGLDQIGAADDGSRLPVGSGLRVAAVVLDAIHPPVGAAAAYAGVQDAGHNAAARIAAARGQAARRQADAGRDSAAARSGAVAGAGEAIAAARASSVGFVTLMESYRADGALAPRERWRAALGANLKRANLLIIDHRLDLGEGPTIDLRRFAPPTSKD
ncbi:hypothetical protein LBMAG53_37860 [Planctomycetota bacterium]|nr:hypothetical protein LBMAG53_37860 [Planctomycetota bacterium]